MSFKKPITDLSLKFICISLVGALTNIVSAGETQLKSDIKSTLYAYTTEIGENGSKDNLALVVEPSITGVYAGKRSDASINLSQTVVEQKNGEDGANKNFTDLKLNSNFQLIENLLRLNINGSQNYQTISQSDDFLTDRVLASGDLTKVQRYSAALNLNTPNVDYVGVTLNSSYSKTTADASLTNNSQLNSQLNNSNMAFSTHLYNGKRLTKIMFDIMANYNDTSRANSNDFTSNNINGNIRLAMFNHTNFVIQGSKQAYEFNQENQSSQRRQLDTTSYGAGFEFFQNSDRRIEITYNQFDEGDNESKYVGLDIDWAFSPRTGFKGNYAKRFYGDAYSASFNFNTKSLRSNFTYSEDVTSFARLSQSSESLGIFVCNIGATSLSECFQPDDLNYVLQPGEEFKSLNGLTNDITDEVILSKSARYVIGYEGKKLKVFLNAGYQETEYLESSRVQKYKSAGLDINYQLGRLTNIGLTTKLLRRDTDSLTSSENTTTVSLNGNRKLSENAQLNIGLRYLNRDSVNDNRDATDKRLTVGFTYQF